MDSVFSVTYFRNSFSTNLRYLLVILLALDALFILLHILVSTTAFSDNPNFRISHEGGYAEHFQYAKSFLMAVLLSILAWRYRVWLFAAWALVFTYIFLDDMLAFHENMGERIGGLFDFAAGLPLRPRDIGEATVLLVCGTSLFLLVWFSYRRSNHDLAKRLSRPLFRLVLAMAFFSIVIDLLHSISGRISTSRAFNIGITLLDEASEHLILSVALVYVLIYVEQMMFAPAASTP